MNNLAGISINCHPREGGDLKLLKKKDTHLRGYDKFGVNRDALAKVTIYTKDYCPYCIKAKALLKRKGVSEIHGSEITHDEALQAEMIQKSGGRRSVPQIFIGDKSIGGCDELYALENAGKLDAMLVC